MADRNLNDYFRAGKFGTREGMIIDIPPSGFDWRAVNQALPAVIDPYAESSYQQFPLGTKLTYGESVFRYALAGATLRVSEILQSLAPLAGHIEETGTVAQAVGDTTMTFTPNTVSTDDLDANELQDGWAFFYDGTGEGYQSRVLSHPAILGGAAGVLTLVDPIRLVNGATVAITVTHNRFYQVFHHADAAIQTATPVGWATGVVTSGYYFWVLTKGETGALIDSGGVAVVMGHPCVPSTEDAGAVQEFNASTAAEPDAGPVGWIRQIGADATSGQATYGQVYAQLE